MKAIIEHKGRLDLLCCLDRIGPLTVPELGTGIGKSPTAIAYLIGPLDKHKVVRKTGKRKGREPLYEARLDDHPAWVREAVEKHCDD